MSLIRGCLNAKYGLNFASSSDDDEEIILLHRMVELDARRHRLRQPVPIQVQSRQHLWRNRKRADAQMMYDYFTTNGTYTPRQFKQRLGMSRGLFEKILFKLCEEDEEWPQRLDAARIPGHSPHMKMVAVMKSLCKSIAADSLDDYTRMGATTTYYYVKRFCANICTIFGPRYLREPTAEDVRRLLAENAARGFPGMLGSVDCMHMKWKNCPVSWQGIHRGKEKVSTLILEAVASYDLWFWHAFFGMPGANNDLNVLAHSPLFDSLLSGYSPPVNYVINGHQYNMGYFLADGIYPRLKTIVQAYPVTLDIPEYVRFNRYQMAKRKDVERAFGSLQGKFKIVGEPCKYWKQHDLNLIMKCCLILHNMIIEHERRDAEWAAVVPEVNRVPTGPTNHYSSLQNEEYYHMLRADLTAHIFALPGRGERIDLDSDLSRSDSEYTTPSSDCYSSVDSIFSEDDVSVDFVLSEAYSNDDDDDDGDDEATGGGFEATNGVEAAGGGFGADDGYGADDEVVEPLD